MVFHQQPLLPHPSQPLRATTRWRGSRTPAHALLYVQASLTVTVRHPVTLSLPLPPSISLSSSLSSLLAASRPISFPRLFSLSRALLNSLHSLKAWVWSMAGRCVTRGTDAGLVYYSTISTSKTTKKGRAGKGGCREANLTARSKEWRTSQITRLLCDTQPSLEFFLPGVKKIYLLTKRFLLNVSVPAREENCSKNWIFRRSGISPCSMNDAIEGERASFNLSRWKVHSDLTSL